ncbi:hypothetical protein [Caulobacter sp. Root1472]|uniref:hypothetical protein n=1 Tax=Caulobacter sp. Root1472 TaxID=1736470 RepID=UPI0007145292|nr:hypothetical protein [Caulobacter sp. Root1472]KQZ21677.1 hypothetical protein ASD47_25065 [Caulobacter sp. Root1472]
MRLEKFGIVLAIAALGLAAPAYAGPDSTTLAPLVGVNARDLGFDFYINGTTNPMGCSQPTAFRIANSMSNRETMAATLLTAFTTQRKVAVYVYNCDTDGASLVASVRMY